MDSDLFSIENLIGLLGCKRTDTKFEGLSMASILQPSFTVDKKDGANDEYVEFKGLGVGFYFESDELMSVFLHSGIDGTDYGKFKNPLPMGANFNHSNAEIEQLLGPPDTQGGGCDGFFGNIPVWYKYSGDGYIVHIEFAPDLKAVNMVTLMRSR